MSITPGPQFAAARPWVGRRAVEHCRPTVRYFMETETHVYAFSVAANVLLSFFPFLLVMASVCKYVFRWPRAVEAIRAAVLDVFPGPLGEFIGNNMVAIARPLEWVSIVLLLFTANGVFEPLEVALNRVWGVKKNRPFWKNQLVSMGLIFACGGLALVSFVLTGLNREFLSTLVAVPWWAGIAVLKGAAALVTILSLWLIYFVLPNRRIRPLRVLPLAIVVGLILELVKYANLLIHPFLLAKLWREYGPFYYSVTIVLWSFVVSMVILGAAEWNARRAIRDRTDRGDAAGAGVGVSNPAAEPSPGTV